MTLHGDRAAARRLLTLCLHGVGRPRRELEPDEEQWWVDVPTLRRILDVVADSGREVELTVDDGNVSDHETILPALVERGLTATFFVIPGRLDLPGSLSRSQVRELTSEGMAIGNHGLEHRSWRTLRGLDDVATELGRSAQLLGDLLGHPVRHAAPPRGDYDRRALSTLRRLGYTRVYTVDGGASVPGRWLRSRYTVHATDTPDRVAGLISSPDGARRDQAVRAAKRALKRWR